MTMANTIAHHGGPVNPTCTARVSSPNTFSKHKDATIHVENMLPQRYHSSEDHCADAPSLEGSSVDAPCSVRDVGSDYAPLRVRIYDDGDDEDEISAQSSETFDMVSEHMASLSDAESLDHVGSFKEFFARSEASSITLNRALMKLNELNSGIASLDTYILENISEEEFRFRLMEIAVANHLPLDDEFIHDILNTLLPLVRAGLMRKRDTIWDLTDYAPGMPVAKLTAENENDFREGSDDADLVVSDRDQSENEVFLPYSAQGLPIHVADGTSEEQEVSDNLRPSHLTMPDMAEALSTVELGHERSALYDKIQQQMTRNGGEHAALEYLPKAGDGSVANSTDTAVTVGTCVHIQRPVGAKGNTSHNVNAASLYQQIPEFIASSEHGFNRSALSSQQETFNDTAKKGAETGGQNGASRETSGVSSKHSTATASGMPLVDDVGLPARSAGWGHSISFIESGIISSTVKNLTAIDDARGKLKVLRLKLLCLAIRLQQSTNNVVRQVLHRLDLADRLRGGSWLGESDLENLKLLAEELEGRRLGCFEFECTILVLGKSGVGKSATINSLFGKVESVTDAFKPATRKVKEIIGIVNGLKLCVIDTPGFLTSFGDKQNNRRILSSVKRYIKKSPPDVVLYVDRLDLQCRDYGELHLFRAINDTLGDAVWYNTIVVFTHGFSAPLDGPNNVPENHEMFVTRRLHTLQQSICKAAGIVQLRNLCCIVENHAADQVNGANHHRLPNSVVWQPQLLLLCFASKILAEADNILRSQGKTFWVRPRVPPLSFLLTLMFQAQAHLTLPNEQVIDEEESDSDEKAIELDDELEYEVLPFFRRLTKEELRFLGKEERGLYYKVLKYREKLCMTKQLMDARARREELTRGLAGSSKEASKFMDKHYEKTTSVTAPVIMPDMALPLTFDSDNPTYRYRFLDSTNGLLVQPVQSKHGWDHDVGYNGLSMEKAFLFSKKIPVSVSGQITMGKKDINVQMECATSFNGRRMQAGLGIHTLRKDVAYDLHGETRFSSFKKHKTTCGLAVTMIGDTSSAGTKLEDCLVVSKRPKLAISGGVMTAEQEAAYGGYLEASFKDKDFPISPFLSTIGLSIITWKKNLAIDGICQVLFLLGQTMIIGQANLNNIRAGQIKIRANSSDQCQMALIGLLPLLRVLIFDRIAGFFKSLH